MDIYIDTGVSLFDFLITVVIGWAVYRGYKRGAIIHSVALLVLLAGIIISAKLSYIFYNFLSERSRIPLVHLPVILFSFLFGFSVIGAHFTANKVIGSIGKDAKGFVTLLTDVSFDTTKSVVNDRPSVTRRHIENEVRVADGETIILGVLKRKTGEEGSPPGKARS